MRNELGAKTESEPRPLILYVCAVALVVLLSVAIAAPTYPVVNLYAEGKIFTLQVADSASARQVGLSGRKTLKPNIGMLFSYPNSGIRCFWMKDMSFALDILWLNAKKQVGYIQSDVSPASYPQQYCPQLQARYVIELKAGVAHSASIHIGQKLDF